MSNQRDIATWVTRPLETGELVFLKGIRPDDPDDRCAICLTQYGTSDEDRAPEHAVRFPCGHDVGNACLHKWLDGVWLKPRCIFCNKSVIPARFLFEQVEEIWSIVSKMSPEAWMRYTPGGPLCQAIRTLNGYIDEANLSQLETPDKSLATDCEGLLAAARSFGHALLEYMQLDNALANRHNIHLRNLEDAKRVFEKRCYRYRRLSERSVVEWADKLSDKSPRHKTWRVTTAILLNILLLFLFTTVILWILYLGIEGVGTVFAGYRPTSVLLFRIHVGVGSFTDIMLCFLLTTVILWFLYLVIEVVGTVLMGRRPTPYLLGRILVEVDCFMEFVLDFNIVSGLLLVLYLGIELVETVLAEHRATPYPLGPILVEVGSFTDILFGSLLMFGYLLVLYSHIGGVGLVLLRHQSTHLLGVRLLEVFRYRAVKDRYERFLLML